MGLCLSKKTKSKSENVKEGDAPAVSQKLNEKSQSEPTPADQVNTAEDGCSGQQVSLDAPCNQQKPQLATVPVESEQQQQSLLLGTLLPCQFASTDCGTSGSPAETPRVATPLRASSCTKEEVESILIQCGRLSRSSSASTDRQRKRGHDLDAKGVYMENDQASGGDGGSSSLRPSPRRRRARSREKRSESNERGGRTGGRRVSLSPGRRARSDGMSGGAAAVAPSGSPSCSSSNAEIPVKMVAVPAREKRIVAGALESAVTRKAAPPTEAPCSASPQSRSATTSHSSAALRGASPQSRSMQVVMVDEDPAGSTLSRPPRIASARSRSPVCTRRSPDENAPNAPLLTRKAEQHQPRRTLSPMREMDGNRLGQAQQQQQQKNLGGDSDSADGSNAHSISRAVGTRRGTTGQSEAKTTIIEAEEKEDTTTATSPNLRVISPNPASSRRSSKDLDDARTKSPANLGPQPTYASILLQDIQKYHQNQQHHQFSSMPAVLLPASVAKARSIFDAGADLNSFDALSASCDGFSSNWHASLKGSGRCGDGGSLPSPTAASSANSVGPADTCQ